MTSSLLDSVQDVEVDRPGAINRALERRWVRITVLAVVLVVLEIVVFSEWFTGQSVPPWDFVKSYAQEAYWWWANGGMWDPPAWIPSVWGGYPASASLQNGGWYIPLGLLSMVTPLTIWALAVSSALHVAFGSIGAYWLVRRLGGGFLPALIAATAWFFAVGHFSNAEHPDISRGYAWAPWLLIVLSANWPWRRWWGFLVGVLLLWQASTGIYPGMLVALGYIGVVWIVIEQIRHRPRVRDFLLPMMIAGMLALGLAMVRLLPYFMVNGSSPPGFNDVSEWSWWLVGTVQFGYDVSTLPNDISMRSFFVPAAVLLLAPFAAWRSRLAVSGAVVFIVSTLMCLPFLPWFEVAQSLPGLGLSRYSMSDFKMPMLLGLLLIAASGAQQLLSDRRRPVRRELWLRLATVAAIVLALGLIVVVGPFGTLENLPTIVALVATAALVAVLAFARGSLASILGGTLVGLTAFSGIAWAFGTDQTWRVPRIETETAELGAPVSELIDAFESTWPSQQRPPRTALPDDVDGFGAENARWNAAYYTGVAAVGGYLNLKGNEVFQTLRYEVVDGPLRTEMKAFMAAAGTAVLASELDDGCVIQDCSVLMVTPISYDLTTFEYSIEAPTGGRIVFNEPAYRGWIAEVCTSTGCVDVMPESTRGLVSLVVQDGASDVVLQYVPPGAEAGRIVSVVTGIGIGIAALWSAVLWPFFLRRRGRIDA